MINTILIVTVLAIISYGIFFEKYEVVLGALIGTGLGLIFGEKKDK